MTASILLAQFAGSGWTMLGGATLLLAGGLALIVSGQRTRDEWLVRRIEMVEPSVDRAARSHPNDRLLRLPLKGLSEQEQREVIRRFAAIGVASNRALSYFVAIRLILVAVLGMLALLWGGQVQAFRAIPHIPYILAAMAAIAGWFVPAMFVSYALRQRTKNVRSGLPDALDLLVVCVEAGLSLEDGLGRVVAELGHSQPALADELGLTLADLRILPSRDQALAGLAARIDIPSVRSVVTTLAQTLRYGTPLAQSLRVVAAEMRNDFLIELEERANRLPVYMTLPVIGFLMPTIFLIVGGPAALRLMDMFARVYTG